MQRILNKKADVLKGVELMRVFVYGSLMKNRFNHKRYLKGQTYLGQAVLPGYALFELSSYPGIIPDPKEKVLGELYEIDNETLKCLDILEGNGHLYNREKVKVCLNNTKETAYVYIWNGKVRQEDKIEFYAQPWNG